MNATETISVAIGDKICGLPKLPDGGQGGGLAFGLHKAGSTMLYKALRIATVGREVQFVNFVQLVRQSGVALEREDLSASAIGAIRDYLQHPGHVFGGWREFPTNYRLPLHASTRTFLLIRDPRDMITSHYFSLKFSHTTAGPDGRNIERARDGLQQVAIDDFALREAPRVVAKFRNYEALNGTELMLRRYEDVIFDKMTLLRDLCAHFGIDANRAQVERAAQAVDERPEAEDVYAHVRQVTPGDHKAKLQPATIESLNETLREVLAKYGYSD